LNFVRIRDEPDSTIRFAGLFWDPPAHGTRIELNILEDGTIEVDEKGYTATDADGAVWISKSVGGRIVMVEK
jgi:hypothetical protein